MDGLFIFEFINVISFVFFFTFIIIIVANVVAQSKKQPKNYRNNHNHNAKGNSQPIRHASQSVHYDRSLSRKNIILISALEEHFGDKYLIETCVPISRVYEKWYGAQSGDASLSQLCADFVFFERGTLKPVLVCDVSEKQKSEIEKEQREVLNFCLLEGIPYLPIKKEDLGNIGKVVDAVDYKMNYDL